MSEKLGRLLGAGLCFLVAYAKRQLTEVVASERSTGQGVEEDVGAKTDNDVRQNGVGGLFGAKYNGYGTNHVSPRYPISRTTR